jgi:hypothetical protein
MNAATMPLEEIRQHGIEALTRESGSVGMVRFLQQFETGKGDCSTERHRWLPDDLSLIAEELKKVDPSADLS